MPVAQQMQSGGFLEEIGQADLLENALETTESLNSLPHLQALPELSCGEKPVVPLVTDISPIMDSTVKRSDSRASLISVNFFKVNAKSKLGIRFKSLNGKLNISHISRNGGIASSPLRPNDHVLSLNGDCACQHWTPMQAVSYLRKCTGYTCIVVMNGLGDPHSLLAAVYKSHPHDKLGISFENDGQGNLRIEKLNKTLLLGNRSILQVLGNRSILRVGDYVKTINNVPCTYLDAKEARQMILESPTLVTIETKDTDVNEVSSHLDLPLPGTTVSIVNLEEDKIEPENQIKAGLISVMVNRISYETKLGIVFRQVAGVLRIVRLKNGCLLASSPLKGGFHLLSINNNWARDWSSRETKKYLDSVVGVVHIVAYNPKGDPNYLQAMVCKPFPREPVGIRLKRAEGRPPLKISGVQEDGLFANSVLNVGDDVISINNIPSTHLLPIVAVDLLKRASTTITILAKTRGSCGVVLSQGRN